ncbi:hypothetical protein MKW98_005432 [Papaver atlanticum]|uniref:Uncharacterized protein n=1 Tax=Papaver atlanticum TaxID=357466 RepID=A0AAD4T399_9MAGN|nr:hypothetical protein MKW98_005432 [Papaver atlanticum]
MVKKLHPISAPSYLGELRHSCSVGKKNLRLAPAIYRAYQVQLSQLKAKKGKENTTFGLISDMSTHKNLSWEPEYDDDEYADNETAALEAQAIAEWRRVRG